MERRDAIENKGREVRKFLKDVKTEKVQYGLSLIGVNPSEIVNQQTIQWPEPYSGSWNYTERDDGIILGYQHVSLIPGSFVVLTCPSYRMYTYEAGFLYDAPLDVNRCEDAIRNLEVKPIKLLFNDVTDITYSDEKITLTAGTSDSYGEISGTTTDSSLSLDGGALGGSIGSGTFDGSISMTRSQEGVIKEIAAEATIKILTRNEVEPLRTKLTPIDINNKEVMSDLHDRPGLFLEQATEDEIEVKKLKDLYQSMKANLQNKINYEHELKKVANNDRFASSDLSDDAYKIFLTTDFEIQKNDVLEKFVVDEKLFGTVEEALKHADELYKNR